MTDDTATEPAAPPPPDEPQAGTPAAEPRAHAPEAAPHAAHAPAVPEAEAGVEDETAPDPEQAPEPAPAAPPELAAAGPAGAAHDAHEAPPAPVQEPVSEEPVPAHDPDATTEPPAEPATEPAAPTGEEPKPKKPRKPRAPKAPAAPETPAAAVETTAAPEGAAAAAEPGEAPAESKKKWYAIKVQSGREDTIKAAILRKVAIEGLEEFFGRIEIPVEEEIVKKAVRVKDKKTGEYTTQEKKVTKKKKKFHGYIFAELEFNDRILYLIRETSGVGDFLNMRHKPGQPPTPEPMPDHEVKAMLTGERQLDPTKKPKLKLDFEKGDKVRIREGAFANAEGEVKSIAEAKDPTDTPKVTVVLTFWGRPLDVELDSWQVEKV